MSAAIILDCITEAETGWDDCWLMRSQRSYLHVSYGLNTMLMSHKWLGRLCLQEYMRIIMQRLALKGQLIFRLWSPAGVKKITRTAEMQFRWYCLLYSRCKLWVVWIPLYTSSTQHFWDIFSLHCIYLTKVIFDLTELDQWKKMDGWMGRWIILISLTTQRVRALNISSATSHQQPQATDGNHTCD